MCTYVYARVFELPGARSEPCCNHSAGTIITSGRAMLFFVNYDELEIRIINSSRSPFSYDDREIEEERESEREGEVNLSIPPTSRVHWPSIDGFLVHNHSFTFCSLITHNRDYSRSLNISSLAFSEYLPPFGTNSLFRERSGSSRMNQMLLSNGYRANIHRLIQAVEARSFKKKKKKKARSTSSAIHLRRGVRDTFVTSRARRRSVESRVGN